MRRDALLMEIETLVKRNPETMRIEERTAVGSPKGYEPGDPGSNYSSTAKVVTVELGGLSGGSGGGGGGGGGGSERARVLMNFGEHARELISSEIALGLLRMLESEQKIQQAAGGGAVGRQTLDALKHTTLVILPMENVSGRRLLEQEGENCLRKTGRIVPGGLGVDPNRNWGVDWGVKEKDYNFNEEYGGSEPFSEPEARIIKKLVEDLNVHAWVNVHSGMAAMFLPIDYQAQVPEDVGMLHNSRIIGSLKAKYCPLCEIGSGGATVGYKAHGTIVDYLWEEAKVPFPMTWEVMGDTEAAFYDCVRMFNPLTKAEYNDVVHRWSAATLEMVRLLPMNPNIPKYDSFVAPTMSELPVPDMKGFTAWHKEQIEKLKDEPSSPAKPDGTTGGGQAGDAGRREEGGGVSRKMGSSPGGVRSELRRRSTGGRRRSTGGRRRSKWRRGSTRGGGTGRTGMMRRRRRLLRRPRQRTWKTSGVTERKGGRGNRAAVRALTPGMVPVPTAARKRGAPSTRTDRFTGGGRKFLPTPCTCNSSCSDASSGCYSSGSSFVNVTAQRSVPGVPSGVSPGGRLACRFSSS